MKCGRFRMSRERRDTRIGKGRTGQTDGTTEIPVEVHRRTYGVGDPLETSGSYPDPQVVYETDATRFGGSVRFGGA